MDMLLQNLVDEFGRWREQVDAVFVEVRMQILPLSGIQIVLELFRNVSSESVRNFFWDILLTDKQTDNRGENITSIHLR